MNKPSNEELQSLASERPEWCISIFMPAVERSQQVRQNSIRFKNLLDQAKDLLLKARMEAPDIEQLFAPANTLLNDRTFWQHQDQGLAIFLSQDTFLQFRLPDEVEEHVFVNHRFYLKPLISLLGQEHNFYILALSQKEVRFLRASQHKIEQVDVPGLPKNMDEALQLDTESEFTQFHPMAQKSGGSAGGQAPMMGYGQGDSNEDKKDDIRRYFRMIDDAIRAYLKADRAPLVLASVEYLQPLYREASAYPNLVTEGITGNPQGIRAEELLEKGWKLVQPMLVNDGASDKETYRGMAGRKDPKAVKDLEEIIKAAPFGRVETLFVDKNAKRWGTFDADTIEVQFEDEPRAGNQDLLDFAAIQTLLNGGKVFVVDPQELPEKESPTAAIFRF